MSAPFLEISNLHVNVGEHPILDGLTLSIPAGEVHAIMGPNGSGKSTLASVLAGKPGYEISAGDVRFNGEPLAGLSPEERAQRGIFLAFQYPTEIPGVSNMEFLKAALDAQHAAKGDAEIDAASFIRAARENAKLLDLDPNFLKRGVNEGFSGGEKKRNEILQLLTLNPTLAVLDETDSGLDIDALQVVSKGVNHFHNPNNSVLLVTHYQRLLDYIVPDKVHVLADGKIVKSGDKSLALELEQRGYGWLTDN